MKDRATTRKARANWCYQERYMTPFRSLAHLRFAHLTAATHPGLMTGNHLLQAGATRGHRLVVHEAARGTVGHVAKRQGEWGNKHTTTNMPVILADGGFRDGQHLAFGTTRIISCPTCLSSCCSGWELDQTGLRPAIARCGVSWGLPTRSVP
jgi:hypothetical protein